MLFRDLGVADLKPRQPAASTSAQALWPGGFLKVEPPVRLRSGCDSSRARAMRPSPRRSRRDRPASRERSLRPRPRLREGRCGDRCSRASRAAIRRWSPDSGPGRRDEDIADLAAIGAAVHPHEAADRAGNAAQELQARRCRRRARSRKPGSRWPRRRSASVTSSSRSIFAKALPSRTMTPGTPPSRTIMLEPSPSAITGMSGQLVRNCDQVLRSAGSNSHSALPPT